jgi:hypothetical protein
VLALGEAEGDLAVERFVAKLRVEAPAAAVLPRASRFDGADRSKIMPGFGWNREIDEAVDICY